MGGAGLGGSGFEFGVDPNEDPELALVSLELHLMFVQIIHVPSNVLRWLKSGYLVSFCGLRTMLF
jgi:hypothetical protein